MSLKTYAAALFFVSVSSSALADANVSTQAFTLKSSRWSYRYLDAVTLISDTNNVAKFSLPGFSEMLDYSLKHDSPYYLYTTGNWALGSYDIGVRAGYEITSIEYSGTFTGGLFAASAPSGSYKIDAGQASNAWSANLYVEGNYSAGQSDTNLTGSMPYHFLSDGMSLTGNFIMDVYGYVEVAVQPATWQLGSWVAAAASTSSMRIVDPIVSITYARVSPVPEPASYALMLGGLALLGAMRRRS